MILAVPVASICMMTAALVMNYPNCPLPHKTNPLCQPVAPIEIFT